MSWGVLSLDELLACGLSHDAVTTRVRNGHLHRVHRGVYAVGHLQLSLEGHLLAAVKACGRRAVLSHYAAAVLWRLLRWDGRKPEVTVAGSATRRRAGLRVHRVGSWAPGDVTFRHGIPVTTPARTLLDLAAVVDEQRLRRAVREAQALRLADAAAMLDVLRRAGPRPGCIALRRLVTEGPAPTRSELEDVVLELILRGGLERPDVNVPLLIDGRRVIPDFRWPHERLVVEADGATWHDGPIARADDAERQALLEAHGERVLRVTWHQAVTRPDETLARLRAAGAPPATTRI